MCTEIARGHTFPADPRPADCRRRCGEGRRTVWEIGPTSARQDTNEWDRFGVEMATYEYRPDMKIEDWTS